MSILIIYNVSYLLENNNLYWHFGNLKGIISYMKFIEKNNMVFLCLIHFKTIYFANKAIQNLRKYKDFSSNRIIFDFLINKPFVWYVLEYNFPIIFLNQKIKFNEKIKSDFSNFEKIDYNEKIDLKTFIWIEVDKKHNFNFIMHKLFFNWRLKIDNNNLENKKEYTLFVKGFPLDATEREISHIFRVFPGYMDTRLNMKNINLKKYNYCFVDFNSYISAFICMKSVNQYYFTDNNILLISFAKRKNDN